MAFKDDTESRINKKRLIFLLKPSWISGLLAVLIAFVLTVGVILTFNLNNSQLKQDLLSFEHTPSSQPALTLPGEAPSTPKNSLQGTLPLVAFWGMTGLVVYFIVEYFVKIIRNTEEFTKELSYVHVKRNAMIKNAFEYIILRLVSALLWLILLDLFFKQIIPYSISLSHRAVSSATVVNSIMDGLAAFIIIVITLHLNVIFLRLVFRRARIIGSAEFLDV
ncbi:MAG TPA: hypothetical protein VLF63_01255 [Patescibacteria group bacterium]|nr:hypothetical protein [Patescibacteria group bacterium]